MHLNKTLGFRVTNDAEVQGILSGRTGAAALSGHLPAVGPAGADTSSAAHAEQEVSA